MSSKSCSVPRGSIVEVKSLAAPPQQVKEVMAAMVILMGDYPVTATSADNTTSAKLSEKTFMAAKRCLGDADILKRLNGFDAKSVTPDQLKAAKFAVDHITLAGIKKNSAAAGDVFKWVQKVMQEAESAA